MCKLVSWYCQHKSIRGVKDVYLTLLIRASYCFLALVLCSKDIVDVLYNVTWGL